MSFFKNDRDRWHFLELTKELVAVYRVRLPVYGLMENHYPLLLELTEVNLCRAMQWLNVSYTV